MYSPRRHVHRNELHDPQANPSQIIFFYIHYAFAQGLTLLIGALVLVYLALKPAAKLPAPRWVGVLASILGCGLLLFTAGVMIATLLHPEWARPLERAFNLGFSWGLLLAIVGAWTR